MSARNIMESLHQGFPTVIIDEAAQANELSSLLPLKLGCRRIVLVGDPNQLPATVSQGLCVAQCLPFIYGGFLLRLRKQVISKYASQMRFDRSLFERLKSAKWPSIMLKEQYRMHPEIRSFPSKYFYSDELTDGEIVLATARKDKEKFGTALPPYLFFDCSEGRQTRHENQTSLCNEAEVY